VAKVIYSMAMSLDGFVETPQHELSWLTPDEEVHQFINERTPLTTALYGRRLYELMSAFWPTADADPDAPEIVVDFARIWRAMPKVVFSSTLKEVAWNSRLVALDAVEEVRRLKESSDQDFDVGGPALAASLIRGGLVDEYQPFVFPVVLGGGTPYFPGGDTPDNLTLLETRTFASGVVFLRYRVDPPKP
jgi:dihydrofolate reductase